MARYLGPLDTFVEDKAPFLVLTSEGSQLSPALGDLMCLASVGSCTHMDISACARTDTHTLTYTLFKIIKLNIKTIIRQRVTKADLTPHPT